MQKSQQSQQSILFCALAAVLFEYFHKLPAIDSLLLCTLMSYASLACDLQKTIVISWDFDFICRKLNFEQWKMVCQS